MDAHPAAALFPLMEGADFAALCDDIREHGQRESIVIFEGKILDGRNRFRACEKLGVKPAVVRLKQNDIGDPIAYVVSANLKRRHLSESQRSMIAVEVEKLYAAEAKIRQREHGGTAPEKSRDTLCTGANSVHAAKEAAITVGVGSRSVSSAKRVAEDGAAPVAEAVRNGKVSVKVAEKLVRTIPDKAKQAAIVNAAVKSDKPDRVINEAVAPKNPPPQYELSDQALDIVERFVVMVEQIYQQYDGPTGFFADKRWDKSQTRYFKQHVHGLQNLLAKLHKDIRNVE